jgi:hypothetical protein|tara:strand:+ start:144 stop:284 length:141 start_codon:yes stop_codon:yes gene_type:complete
MTENGKTKHLVQSIWFFASGTNIQRRAKVKPAAAMLWSDSNNGAER